MFRHALTATVLLGAILAHAKTPSEIYEQAAKSTVVVRNIDSGGKAKSMGSGVILPDRDVVTNCHVVKGASQLKVRIGKNEYPAALRHSDWDRDVCSLSVSGISDPAVVIGSTKSLKVGAKVYAIGAPKGLELTLSDGIVSSLREVDGGLYIQTTAAISPGSSGGGLFDENGALVGLTTFYLAEGQNLNFAVPVEWVKELPKRQAPTPKPGQSTLLWLNKAIELQTRENQTASIEHCLNWTKAQPESAYSWFSLGGAYLKSKDFNRSIEAFLQALRIQPEWHHTWSVLGSLYALINQEQKAIDALSESLRINPENAAAWRSLGRVLISSNKAVKAIEALQQALKIDPDDPESWLLLGVAYTLVDQRAKAIDAYLQSLRIEPKNPDALISLGMAYGVERQYPAAIDAFQQGLRLKPTDSFGWYFMGVAHAKLGHRDKVLEVYKQIKTLDQDLAERFFKGVVAP